jgi:putative ABC transport system permease protein
MDALRSNMLRTLLSLLGVTIGIFSIIAVLAAVDSLDRKISKDLSGLDKNTIYLMKFFLGSLKFQSGKESSFPILSMMNTLHERVYDEYRPIRLSNFTKRESIKYDSKTVSDVNMVPVSYEFIDKGLESKRKIL